jgi:hypothetical protein
MAKRKGTKGQKTSTKLYTTNEKANNTNPTKNVG